MTSMLETLAAGASELTADQIDATAGGLLPPIEGWWCLLFPETCTPWF